MGYTGERLAQKGSRWLGAVQAARPAAEGSGIGQAIGVFERGRRLFPRAVLRKAPPQGLATSQQAVVGVRERNPRQKGEGLPAILAKAAPDSNPVVMLIVCLLAAATMTDDGIAFAKWAAPQDNLLAVVSPIGFELV